MIDNKKYFEYKKFADEALKKILSSGNSAFQNQILEAMKYSTLSNGKRIRMILAFSVYELFKQLRDVDIKFIASIELIHTYSLIHDDLPSMDDDDYRRGRLTLHKKFDEAMAILAGDGLLNLAYENMINIALDEKDEKYLKAMKIIADSAGINGMILGQVADIYSTNILSKEELDFINLNKTGALINASILTGAILAGSPVDMMNKFKKVASNIGLAFQIVDDVLDIEGDEEILGKPVGSDDLNNKITYPTLLGLGNSKKIIKELSDEAIFILKELKLDTEFLEKLIIYLIYRKK